VLADDCTDYCHEFGGEGETSGEKVKVVNPGNFSKDKSFAVLYPTVGQVQPSKAT